ncbi:MAG: MFS transporter [Caldilineaceae bacterium]|nr:MFS transporter [Caldilineaceae bacterium]MCB0094884.1 MFS transporter [Caldilineaceae bacterium]
MYQVENSGDLIKNKRQHLWARVNWATVGRTVFLLGLTSFLTDISAEMVSTTLPIYLMVMLHFTPFQVGLVDGLYQGAAVLVKVISGLIADRYRKPKEVAATGYLFSALCKLGYLLVGSSWAAISGVVFLDRVGKGIRTAPRDAMIAASSQPTQLATAFGIHRALDTAGAMLGPLLAVAILMVAPGAYDAIFVVSLCIALVGVAVIGLFVHNPDRTPNEPDALPSPAESERVSVRTALSLLAQPQFRRLVIIGSALALVTVSDGLLYLTLQRRLGLTTSFFPLLFVITAFIYMLLAIPVGRLADRLGHKRTFLAGYAVLALVYTVLLLPVNVYVAAGGMLLLLGIYYAATDGVLMALASGLLPPHLRTTGLALLTTGTGVARLLASTLYGAVWNWVGAEQALLVYIGGIVLVLVAASASLKRLSA